MDRENRGKLTTAEFVKLMMFLGYGEKWKVDVRIRLLWWLVCVVVIFSLFQGEKIRAVN